jgi:hypothetical protein
VAVVGDFRQGKWVAAESMPWPSGPRQLEIDQDRATMVTLICHRNQQPHWKQFLELLLQHPDRIEGY